MSAPQIKKPEVRQLTPEKFRVWLPVFVLYMNLPTTGKSNMDKAKGQV